MQILTSFGFGSKGSSSIKCHLSVLIFHVMWLLSDDIRSEKRERYYSAAENRKKVLPRQGRAGTHRLQCIGSL